MTLRFCTAWPAAPFHQVVEAGHEDQPARRLVDAPADVAEVRVRDVLDFGQRVAGQPHEGVGPVGRFVGVVASAASVAPGLTRT